MASEAAFDTPQAPPPTAGPLRLRPSEAIERGWEVFRKHFGVSLGAALLVLVLTAAGSLIPFRNVWLGALNLFFAYLVTPALGAGAVRFLVRMLRGESPAIASIFDGFRRWRIVTAASFVSSAVMFAIMAPLMLTVYPRTMGYGANEVDALRAFHILHSAPALALLVVTGVVCTWWALRLWPLLYVAMEPECAGAMDAIRASWALTRGSLWRGVGLMVLSLLVFLVGLLALCVGSIPAMITLYYAWAVAYEQLRARAGVVPAVAVVPEALPASPVL